MLYPFASSVLFCFERPCPRRSYPSRAQAHPLDQTSHFRHGSTPFGVRPSLPSFGRLSYSPCPRSRPSGSVLYSNQIKFCYVWICRILFPRDSSPHVTPTVAHRHLLPLSHISLCYRTDSTPQAQEHLFSVVPHTQRPPLLFFIVEHSVLVINNHTLPVVLPRNDLTDSVPV